VLWAIAHARELSTAERCVLFVVESFVGFADRNTGEARPGVAAIAAGAGIEPRWCQRVLRGLEEKRWLTIDAHIEGGWQGANRYRVTPPEDEPQPPVDEPDPAVH